MGCELLVPSAGGNFGPTTCCSPGNQLTSSCSASAHWFRKKCVPEIPDLLFVLQWAYLKFTDVAARSCSLFIVTVEVVYHPPVDGHLGYF